MNAIAPYKPTGMMDPATFDHMQRVGQMLALSPLFPEHLRKGHPNAAIANAVLCMNMAVRLQEDVLTVAQNIYFVGGKPGWNTTYMIAKANQSGVFRDGIDWEYTGTGETLAATAFAVLSSTGKTVKVTCDMKMAKAEGWTKNPKYQSIPEQMLSYRSAAFLIRRFCPEVMIGLPAAIEVETGMRDITPQDQDLPPAAKPAEPEKPAPKADPVIDLTAADPAAKDPAPVEDAKDAAPVADEKPVTAAPDPEEIKERNGKIYSTVMIELMDGAALATVQETYAEALATMKAEAPGMYAELVAEMDAFKPATEGGGQAQMQV